MIIVEGDDTYPIEMAMEVTRLLKANDVVIVTQEYHRAGRQDQTVGCEDYPPSLLAQALFGARISDVCPGFCG